MLTREAPLVSVIVPAFNEEAVIGRCLNSIRSLEYPPDRIELIVVDNGSTDRTSEIAIQYGAKVIVKFGGTVAGLRNFGAQEASGEILAFIDSDCSADSVWLTAAVMCIENSRCVTGSECEVPAELSWVSKAWFCVRPQGRLPVQGINSANLIVPLDIFKRVGGFNETLRTGEDTEFCARAAKIAPVISDSAIRVVHYGVPKNIYQFFKREIWHGLGALGTFRQNIFDKPFLGTIFFGCMIVVLLLGLFAQRFDPNHLLIILPFVGVVLLTSMSVIHRRRYLTGPIHALQLGLLFFVFFLGRFVSLVCMSSPRAFYHHDRRD